MLRALPYAPETWHFWICLLGAVSPQRCVHVWHFPSSALRRLFAWPHAGLSHTDTDQYFAGHPVATSYSQSELSLRLSSSRPLPANSTATALSSASYMPACWAVPVFPLPVPWLQAISRQEAGDILGLNSFASCPSRTAVLHCLITGAITVFALLLKFFLKPHPAVIE